MTDAGGHPTGPVVSLREITQDNRAAVEALAVTDEQDFFVATVTQSLKDAEDEADAKPWYRAVYADDEPVGFVMISDGITVDDPSYVGPTSSGGCSPAHENTANGLSWSRDPASYNSVVTPLEAPVRSSSWRRC
ncbi:MAG TPA: hypothetical protein VGO19_09325 [Actinomycetes bacterium]